MASLTTTPESLNSSTASFYTACDSTMDRSTTASSRSQSLPCPYRAARQLHHELTAHCQIFLEEQLYTSAINLLNSILASGVSRRSPPTKPALIPPPRHLALLNTLIVHPIHTTRAETPERLQVSALALDYLRNLLTVVGPVNAGFRAAFQYHAPSRWTRRSGYTSDSDVSDGDSSHDHDSIKGNMANQSGLWTRGQDLWTTVGWAFNTSSLHPHRWRYWKLWLEFMLDVLEMDWAERERLDNASHEPETGQSAERASPTAARAQSMIAMHVWPDADGQMALKRIMKALFADGTSMYVASFPEVFDKETRGPKKACATNKRKRDSVLDLENNKFGDYFDDESLSSGISEPPTPPKLRAGGRNADNPGPWQQTGLVESVHLRLRFFKLLSAATDDLGKPGDLLRLYENFSFYIKSLPLELFALFVSQRENPLLPEVHVSILKQLFSCLLPSRYQDPQKIDPVAHAQGCLTTAMLQHCYACLPANTVALEDNAKLSLVVESAIQLLWLSDVLEYSEDFEAACEEGMRARETKAKKRRMGKGRADARDVVAEDVLAGSRERIRALLCAARVIVVD
ncbi:hypothetical protein E4U46_002153 [Claviceps purpurea]|nr:hypothetical protein E4U46_002153 [Claviceps purpurea]